MEKQVDVEVRPDSENDARLRVRWYLCDNGMAVAEGIASWERAAGKLTWGAERPPADCEGLVRAAIDRAARAQE